MNLVFLFLMSKENLIGLLFNCEVMSNSFVTPWTIIHQASLSMGFPSQEYRNGLSFLLQGLFHTQVSNPCLPPWQADSLPLSNQGSPSWLLKKKKKRFLPSLNNNRDRKKELCLVYDIWKKESLSSKLPGRNKPPFQETRADRL